jgi:Na+/H+ antiporter NhaD/arsenite permease-like protein
MARPYWEALSFGAPVAVFILLIGALAGIILAYLPIRRQTMGEGKS